MSPGGSFSAVEGAPASFGRVAEPGAKPAALTQELHHHGFLLFPGKSILPGGTGRSGSVMTAGELVDFVRSHFPQLQPQPVAAGARNTMAGPIVALGNLAAGTSDSTAATAQHSSSWAPEYTAPVTGGAPLIGASPQQVTHSLGLWLQHSTEASMMEWHVDTIRIATPPSYGLLYCVQAGGSRTAFADTVAAYRSLPPGLRAQAVNAVAKYRGSISFGNSSIGIPALPRRQIQQATYHRNLPTGEVLGLRARLAAANRAAAEHCTLDQTVRHKLVQPHPHTGELALRLDPASLEWVEGMPIEDGHQLVWELLRRAAQPEHTYLHQWQEGDLLVWCQRRTMHARVPYDASREVRLMWRMNVERDPADSRL